MVLESGIATHITELKSHLLAMVEQEHKLSGQQLKEGLPAEHAFAELLRFEHHGQQLMDGLLNCEDE